MMASADRGGVKIAYERRGSGPPLLMLHGLGYSGAGWGPAIEPLARRFELLLVDNRGIGSSDVPPGPYSAADLAADAVAVLDDAELERVDVLGISLGGMVAQELAIGWPRRVGRLVLAATTPGGPHSWPWPEATARLLAGDTNGDVRSLVAEALGPGTEEAVLDQILELRARTAQPPQAWRAQAAASLGFDAYERLGQIAAPTLVVHGDADAVVDHRNAALLAERIPGAHAELIAGGGHLLPWDRPQPLARLVVDFLDGRAA